MIMISSGIWHNRFYTLKRQNIAYWDIILLIEG